ncbi:MAG: carboxypeptidase regulatory-like domain-containing protein, partial [Nitrospirota bacterium]|nr:carboxypeptidase regulatory-like domain-containing protein [Nitrospirota bacterium]
PHIAVGLVTQQLEVQNFDPILHNTHIRTKKRAFFNVVLLPQSKGIKKVMKEPGLMTISCNKHPFMMGYVQIFDHPFHAITDTHGVFSIPNLPHGTHRLTIWHKTLGTAHHTVTIPPKNSTTLDIEFPAR